MSPILALSVTDKIEQYGAYAGFASVLGLAVLSLLYFAQAREVKRLREWAGRAPERAAEIEARVQADAQRRVTPQPVAQPQPGQAAQPLPPGQPPAPGAPRPAAAPAPATAAAQAQQGAPGATPGVAAPVTAAAAGAAAGAAAAAKPGQPTTVQPAVGAPGAPGAPAGNGAPPPARPGQPLRVPPGSPAARPAAGSVSARSLGQPPASEGRSRGTILAIAGAITAVVVVGLVLVFVVFGGSDGSNTEAPAGGSSAQATTPAADQGATTPSGSSTTPLSPGSFTTAVLNGTTVPGLARGVANRLDGESFKIGTVTNALDQSRSQTLVEYVPGHRREGLLVAKAIDVAPDAVQQASSGTRTLAGDAALVIVTVGNDQNQSPQQ